MPVHILLDAALTWRQVAAVAEGLPIVLSEAAERRIRMARSLVEALIAQGTRAYGINTGVGALCDVVVEPARLRELSRNIIMSHAVGIGASLEPAQVRAIVVAAINNYSHGYSGVRVEVVERLLELLAADCLPEVPVGGSIGYLSHMAHVALVLIGEGWVRLDGVRRSGSAAHTALERKPLVLEAKEGLSLVNGTPCATGLLSLALLRAERLLDWADVISAMTFENLRGQIAAFDAETLSVRASTAVCEVGERLRSMLDGSGILQEGRGKRTQDALSLRAIPQVHGAAREVFAHTAETVNRELAAVTDNPIVFGTEDAPRVASEAHAVGAAIGMSADSLAVALAEVAAMSERRMDRLVNPLVSGLPAFLAADGGAGSGFMIAQYAAAALVADNRRLAAPASLDGGVTSGLQEDHLCHATPAAIKLLRVLDNCEYLLGIELLAAAQAYDLQPGFLLRAPNTDIVHRAVRARIAHYRDDRPLNEDIEMARALIREPTDGEPAVVADEPAPARRPRAPRRPRASGARTPVAKP